MTDLPAAPAAKPGTQLSRVMLGFALAPMLPAFYSALFFAQPWAFPIGVGLSYPAALLIGLPLFLLLRRHGRLGWWQLALCGAACALPAMLLYAWVGAPPHLEPFDLANGLYLELWGAFSGVSFWLIAVAGTSPVSLGVLFGLGI